MTIGSHQRSIGKDQARFTPRYIWEVLGPFDTDAATGARPKSKQNPNWKAKLRQTLQRGAGKSVGRDQWVVA